MAIRLLGSLDMNDIKKEDAMRFAEKEHGGVQGVAVIVDGATGFQKDIDAAGNIIALKDIVEGKHSSARVWADILADKLLETAQSDQLGLVDGLRQAIQSASAEMPVNTKDFASFQAPSAAVIMARIKDGMFEVIGSGDCCLLVEYQDGRVDTITGNTILDNIRAQRDMRIKRENPGFDNLGKEEQAKIRFRYMKQTRESLGDPKKGYFVPFYQSVKAMDSFLGEQKVTSADNVRSINNIKRGDIWVMYARAEEVKAFMVSSDGFVDKVLKNKLAKPGELINLGKNQIYLNRLGEKLRQIEMGSDRDHHATAMKIAQGKKNTGSADDAVALCFNVNVPNQKAFNNRQRIMPVPMSHYRQKS